MKRWKKLFAKGDSPPALPFREGALRLLKKLAARIWRYLTMRNRPAPVPALCVKGVAPSLTGRAGGESFGPKCCEPLSRSQVLSWLRSDCRASERTIDLLVVHCSATWPSINYTYERLLRDHKARGFGNYPGYHIYIRRDGTLYYCRPVSIAGCHVANFNRHSIGICYEGGCSDSAGHKPEDNRTAEQLVVMHEVLSLLVEEYPEAKLVGHRDLNGGKKACPCFDVKSYYGYLDPPPKR